MIDKFGKCPHCNRNWNGKDMLEELKKLSVTNYKQEAANNLADRYGYTPENEQHFSRVTTYEIDGRTYYQCPSVLCGHIFDAETGVEYASLIGVKINKPYIKPEEDD